MKSVNKQVIKVMVRQKIAPGFSLLETTYTGMHNNEESILFPTVNPVEITFIDENDYVCHFPGTKGSVFPRSTMIVSRKVQTAPSPPKSELRPADP